MDLASPLEPLILANGMKIDPRTGSMIREKVVAIPNNIEARKKITAVHATLQDLPDVAERINVVGAIITYALFGLSDEDIGIALGIPKELIERIKLSDAYKKMRDTVVDNVQQHEDDLSRIIASHASDAVNTLVDLMQNEETDDKVKLMASKDILDRSGYSPKQIVEHRNSMQQSLRIEVVHKTPNEEIPILDLTPVHKEIAQ
jgi:hypothetical protein